MSIEWDENKRQKNLQEREVDFVRAAGIFLNPTIEEPDTRRNYGETRIRAVGMTGDECFVVVYTWRGSARRIISAWKAGKNERRKYQTLLTG